MTALDTAALIVRDVCELNRSSPDYDPDMMLVYPHELEEIVRRRLAESAKALSDALWPAPSGNTGGSDDPN
jgi:hypothetical protein